MATRTMPTNILYGNTSSATSRSRTPSSLVVGGKGSHSTHTTVSSRTTSTYPSVGSLRNTGSSISNRETKLGGAKNNSTRSTSSAGRSGRKISRSSFRKTLMFQKTKRKNATNSDTNETTVPTKPLPSKAVSATPLVYRASSARPRKVFQKSHRFRGNGGAAVVPLIAPDNREAEACSRTLPQPQPKTTTANNDGVLSVAVPSQQNPPQEQVANKEEENLEYEKIPPSHVDTILRIYGKPSCSPSPLDLYRDVLQISPEATDREIRIAYFRRGREILGDASKSSRNHAVTKARASKLDPVTKTRFQAVSMAYEILSTPTWKETYMREGGLSRRNDSNIDIDTKTSMPKNSLDAFSSPSSTVAAAFPNSSESADGRIRDSANATPSFSKTKSNEPEGKKSRPRMPTVLRKSSFLRRGQSGNTSPRRSLSIRRSSSSVRWKDHVEELVFANHPNEHAGDDNSGSSSGSDVQIPEDDDILEEEELRETGSARNGLMPCGSYSDPSCSEHGSKSTWESNSNASGRSSSKSSRRRKNKPKVVIDSDELESHLKRMDNEAEKHFVQDFWDNFEESMDGILSIVDSLGGGDTSKSTTKKKNDKNSTAAPFSSASSWLSPASSMKSSSVSQRRTNRKGSLDATNATISRSSSHDMTISSNSIADDINDEGILRRTNSFPCSTLDAISSPQPPKLNGGSSVARTVVTPDEKLATATKSGMDSGISSPFDLIVNSWPFQSIKPQEENNGPQMSSPAPTAPTAVSPSPSSKMSTTSHRHGGGSSAHSDIDMSTSTSVASSILSTSQPRQKMFRPISPTSSEASDQVTSDLVPLSLASSSNRTSSSNAIIDADSDRFELDSHLSGLESLDLTELDNPFRRRGLSPSSKPAGAANANLQSPSRSGSPSDTVTNNSDPATNSPKKKKSRFRVSMLSKIRGPSKEKEKSPPQNLSQFDKSSTHSRASKGGQSVEDVFAGVEEDSQPQEQYGMKNTKLKGQDILMDPTVSHMSDLSGSTYSSKKENKVETIHYEFASARPSAVAQASVPATDTGSVLSSATKKSQANSTSETTYSSCASSTRDGTTSVPSLETMGVESSGFIDYFVAYATAVMTECASLGAAAGVPEYQQNFMSMFFDEPAHTAEIRVQSASTQLVPS